jgi:hypothetical protein
MGKGGALFTISGTTFLDNSTLADNTAQAGTAGSGGAGASFGSGTAGSAGNPGDAAGGAVFLLGGGLNFNNSTVTLNQRVGAIHGLGDGVTVQGGIVTANSALFAGNGTSDFVGNVTANFSLFQTAPSGGTLNGSSNLQGVDPLLDPAGLASNGGPTQTVALQAGSPALGAGSNVARLFTDQRGGGPRTGPGGTDIGAYQHDASSDTQAPTITVTAPGVSVINASSLNPYSFTLTFDDDQAIAAASLAGATVQVITPGGSTIAATLKAVDAVLPTDVFSDSAEQRLTYEITPPAGAWAVTGDNGTYSINLGGTPITDLAGNRAAMGTVGSFKVQINNDHLALTTPPPNSIGAGSPYGATVAIEDAGNHVDATYNGDVALTPIPNPGASALGGSYTVKAVNGVATFSNLTNTLAGTYTLQVSSGILASVNSASMTVNPAPASVLNVSYPTAVAAGDGHDYVVTAVDAYGNVVQNYAGTVHFTSTDSKAGLPVDYTFVPGTDNGTHTFNFPMGTTGTQAVRARDTAQPLVTGVQTGIVVTPGVAVVLTVTGYPTTTSAGDAHSLTVTALDSEGNVATGYTGTIHFNASESKALLPADYPFTAADAGKHTFPVTFETVGVQAVRARDTATSTITGREIGISVTPGPLHAFSTVYNTTSTAAGVAHFLTVTAVDAFGNVETGYTGTVNFTSTDAQLVLPKTYTFVAGDAGKHTFTATFDTVGTQAVRATDSIHSTITGVQTGIVVTPGPAHLFSVLGFPTTTIDGAAHSLTVSVYDAYGNLATNYTGTIHFTSTDSKALLPEDYTFTAGDAGKHLFLVTFETPGTQAVRASDALHPTITGVETGIAASCGSATTFAVIGFPSPTAVGVAHTLQVSAYDAYGNLATSYTGTVHFTSTDSGVSAVPNNYTFTASDAGRHLFLVTFATPGTQAIRASDTVHPTVTGVQSGITITSPAATSVTLAGFPTAVTAGDVHNVTVTLYDSSGKVATGYTGTVVFSSTDAKLAGLPASYTFKASDAGTHTFTGVSFETAGNDSLRVSDSAHPTITALDSSIQVSPAAASSFSVTSFPATTAGTSGNFTVTAHDAFGNLATGYTGTMHITSSDSKASLPADYTFKAADGGSHTLSAILVTSGTQSLTVTDTAHGTITGTQTGILVSPAAAASFVVAYPAATTAGDTHDLTVTAYDTYGNVASGYIGTIHLTSSDSHAVLAADYTFKAGDGGVHTFSGASLHTAGSQALRATDSVHSSITGLETGIIVSAASASRLAVTGIPTSVAVDTQQSFTVTLYDAYGNIATGYTGTVGFSSDDASAVFQAPYSFQPTDAGQAKFTVTFKTTGTHKVTVTDTTDSSLTGTESSIDVT